MAFIFIATIGVQAANTYTMVPGQSIQAAINGAAAGDTVVVQGGYYRENVNVNKAVTLIGIGLPVVDGSGNAPFLVTANNVILQGFNATNASGDAGITVTSNNTTISGNIANNNRFGINVYGWNNHLVGNTANDNLYEGITLMGSTYGCEYNTVIGNTVNGNDYADIYIYNSSNNTISSNTVNSSPIGIFLSHQSQFNSIVGNKAYDDSKGIQLSSSNNSLAANSLTYGVQGILLGGNDNKITGNFIGNNTIAGIELQGAMRNIIWLNVLKDNENNARQDTGGQNFWNSSAELSYAYGGSPFTNFTGNYWDDNQTPDDNGDGIVDSPYQIDAYNIDYNPMLMDAAPTGRVMNLRTGLTYQQISGAVSDVNTIDGDTIVASSGYYPEAVGVNKAVTLIGVDTGSGLPVVDSPVMGPAIAILSNNANISGFNATGSQTGIYVWADNVNVIGNNVSGYNDNGIALDNSANCNVFENVVNNNPCGIYLDSSTRPAGINNKIIGNTVDNCSVEGISIWGNDNVVAANTASGNVEGIRIIYSTGNGVTGNTIAHSPSFGMDITASYVNTIVGNSVIDNNRGIGIFGSDDNTIEGNLASNNTGEGIYSNGGSGNNLTGNILGNNLHGIYLEGWNSHINFTRNNISGNGNGIYLGDSVNCNITENNLSDNSCGIYLRNSSGNVLWLNVIASNDVNASVSGGGVNRWNSTVPVSYTYAGSPHSNYTGNYWGDYDGPDANADGIGDVPRVLDADNTDYYPMLLAEPELPYLQFELGAYSVNENTGTVTLTVERIGPQDHAVSVNYATVDGSAHSGTNYQAPSPNPSVLTIPAGASYGEITIPILDDGLFTLSKNFTVSMSSPTGAVLGSRASATVTISDQDPAPVFTLSTSAYEVYESAGTVTFTIIRTNNAERSAAVDINMSDGTAVEGVNYVNTSGRLFFNKGVMSRTFTVTILNDSVTTDDLAFNVRLTTAYSSPGGASVGTPGQATVTIHEGGAPPVANFTADTRVDAIPFTVHFTDLSTGYPTSWEWNFGDGMPNGTTKNVDHTYGGLGTFTVTLTVRNANGSSTMVKTDYIRGAESSTVIPLTAGWNLVSYPFASGDSISVEEVFAPVMDHVTIIWAYDPAEGWLYYIPGGSDNTLSSIDDTMGVWVLASSDADLPVYGTTPEDPIPISMGAGWNLIGYPGLESYTPADAFASIDGKYSVVWGFDDPSKAWQWYVPGGDDNNLNSIEPGCGYWIQMNEAGVLTPVV